MIIRFKFCLLTYIFLILIFSSAFPQDSGEIQLPPQLRMLRIYGGNDETLPPIILAGTENKIGVNSPVGESRLTIEFDVDASVPPNLYAKFRHCSVDWSEDENVFLNDIISLRTTRIEWQSSPIMASYYTFRGKISVPDEQVKFSYSGNWKVKLYEYGNDSHPFAEGRFFVVNPLVDCTMMIEGDFYYPGNSLSGSAFDISVYAKRTNSMSSLIENNLNTVVVYRKNRWWEPYYISERNDLEIDSNLYKYTYETESGGFSSVGKIFRVNKIPAENEYRILDLTNLTSFPRTTAPVSLPFSDLRRIGSFEDYDDDGAMITSLLTHNDEDYVYVEFVLNPDGWFTRDDIYVAGSFNEWKPDESWQMYYDENMRNYRLRHWVRRARHNYMYATGKFNLDTRKVEKMSFVDYEGNTSASNHTFIALVYYRMFDYGGYDALIGVGAASIYGSLRR